MYGATTGMISRKVKNKCSWVPITTLLKGLKDLNVQVKAQRALVTLAQGSGGNDEGKLNLHQSCRNGRIKYSSIHFTPQPL